MTKEHIIIILDTASFFCVITDLYGKERLNDLSSKIKILNDKTNIRTILSTYKPIVTETPKALKRSGDPEIIFISICIALVTFLIRFLAYLIIKFASLFPFEGILLTIGVVLFIASKI